MGNCLYQMDSLAPAILCYERALKLNPRFDKARQNLHLVGSRIDNPIIAIDEFFLLKWIRNTSAIMPPMLWGAFLILLVWAIAWLYILQVRKRLQVKLRYKVITALFVLIVAGLGYISYYELTRNDLAVLMKDTQLHVAPDPVSQVVRPLEGGEKMRNPRLPGWVL